MKVCENFIEMEMVTTIMGVSMMLAINTYGKTPHICVCFFTCVYPFVKRIHYDYERKPVFSKCCML